MPETVAAGPTGLQKSMRFLLQVIAGLLLADFVTKSVEIIDKKPGIWNVLALTALGAFLFRLFTDNLLYYEATDRKVAGRGEYPIRLVLLALDLISYVICYDMVYRLKSYANEPLSATIPIDVILRIMRDIAVVELLHLAWAVLTYICLKNWHREGDRNQFRKWAILSCCTGVGMWFFTLLTRDQSSAIALFAAGSVISLVAYLGFMRKQYQQVVV